MEGKRQEVCAGCGALSPEMTSDNTLISSMGWRLRRFTNEQGEPGFEWRCAGCWAAYKQSMGRVLSANPDGPVTQRLTNVLARPAESSPPVPVEDRETEKSISLASVPQRDRAALTVMTGITSGRVYTIEQAETVIGRAPEADVWLEEASISRKHARIVKRADGFTLEDLESTNGTFVGGVRVDEHHHVLESGDHIQLGPNLIFRFAVVDEAEVVLQRRLYESSTRDALTRAFNRKYLHERLAQEVAHARRHNAQLAILMMDFDLFKTINDTYGHLAGDEALRSVADLVHHLVRLEDVFARYGGEEFVVLARSTSHTDALVFAERLRAAIDARTIDVDGKAIKVTVSIGVASLSELPNAGALELLSLADSRLLRAKAAGRNRVCGEA